ncbi:MAG TPA: alpha/beta fold hydrolase [Patescibacteria group bacterium]|jgi:proline iminopeptidase|nr:alpha/beta fold hydrolase [Patescibacteria group bacterium]
MTPDKYTLQERFVDVGNEHQLYVQDWGNPKAKNIFVFLHGGPGGSVKDNHRLLFNPDKQRVIFFDQRGCGHSTPFGSIEHNTTGYLVEDVEKILVTLDIKSCILVGGSWGSCLALAYALKYPKRVKAMAIRGIFTGSEAELQFIEKGQFQNFFPDTWSRYLQDTPPSHRSDPSAYHIARILGDNPEEAKISAYAFCNMENSLMSLDDRTTPEDYDTFDLLPTRIEVYYFANRCFMSERYILSNAHKLNMPVWIVQGRYDFVCPPQTAYELNQAIKTSTLIWTVAGHGSDRSNYDVTRAIIAQW